jgi:hypothetical protein
VRDSEFGVQSDRLRELCCSVVEEVVLYCTILYNTVLYCTMLTFTMS